MSVAAIIERGGNFVVGWKILHWFFYRNLSQFLLKVQCSTSYPPVWETLQKMSSPSFTCK